jgi:hypothetical protein
MQTSLFQGEKLRIFSGEKKIGLRFSTGGGTTKTPSVSCTFTSFRNAARTKLL